MEAHALKYSKGYQAKKGFTFWERDFDAMAYKTMLRQLISKWGIMSIDLQTAIDSDMAVIREDGTKDYVELEPVDVEAQNPALDPEQTIVPAPAEPVKEQTQAESVSSALFG